MSQTEYFHSPEFFMQRHSWARSYWKTVREIYWLRKFHRIPSLPERIQWQRIRLSRHLASLLFGLRQERLEWCISPARFFCPRRFRLRFLVTSIAWDHYLYSWKSSKMRETFRLEMDWLQDPTERKKIFRSLYRSLFLPGRRWKAAFAWIME